MTHDHMHRPSCSLTDAHLINCYINAKVQPQAQVLCLCMQDFANCVPQQNSTTSSTLMTSSTLQTVAQVAMEFL